MSQGHFAEWLDGTPLLQTSWYESSVTQLGQYKVSIYTQSGHHLMREVRNLQKQVLRNQPVNKTVDNCTAAITSPTTTLFVWIVIPCDTIFEATFICENVVISSPINFSLILNPLNAHMCEDGWILMSDSNKCYVLLTAPKGELSFAQTSNVCSSANGSVLSVNTFRRPDVYTESGQHLLRILRYTTHNKTLSVASTFKLQDSAAIMDLLFGQPLRRVTIERSLSYLLYIAENGELLPLKFVSIVNDKCGIIVVSYWSTRFQKYLDDRFSDGWGAKYRPCLSKISHISAIICEKKSVPYKPLCPRGYFSCADSGCILSVYVCDGVNDCFDKSDENVCKHSTLQLNTIILPCILTSKCMVLKSDILVYIHAICDGRNVYEISYLNTLCDQNKKVSIKTHAMQNNFYFGSQQVFKQTTQIIMNLYKTELYFQRQRVSENVDSPNPNITMISVSKYMVPCRLSGNKVYLEDRCKISVHSTPCNYGNVPILCQHVVCPGMFKCTGFYCIHMSAVCDGHSDCFHGEDEKHCTDLVCPFSLKCRSENRCVSQKEICDGHLDCIFSADDEIMCHPCVDGCQCAGYVAYCTMIDNIRYDQIITMLHLKGLVIKTTCTSLYVKKLKLASLSYLNISHSRIESVKLNGTTSTNISFIFIDFSYNSIMSTLFLRDPIFSNVTFLNLQYNLVTHFGDEYTKLNYLTALYMNHNPLVFIYLNHQQLLIRLKLVNILYVKFKPNMIVYFTKRDISNVTIYVSESTVCCLFPQNINCTGHFNIAKCFGIIEHNIMKLSFYFLAVGALMLSLSSLVTRIIIELKNKSHTNNIKIIKSNLIIAEIVFSTYLICLVISNIIDVNVVEFRKHLFCMFLNASCFITFDVYFLFKAMQIIIIVLKIMYPFRHQCRWLLFIGMVCGMSWLFVTALYIINTVQRYMINKVIFFDKLCSFAECDDNSTHYMLPITDAIINMMCLISIVISLIVFFICLRIHSKATQGMYSSVRIFPIHIVFKLSRPVYSDLLLRVYILLMFSSHKIGYYFNQNTCLISFIILAPINIMVSSICNLVELLSTKNSGK